MTYPIHLDIYRANRAEPARLVTSMADLYDRQTGRLSDALVAAAAVGPATCCSLLACSHSRSLVASAAGQWACCATDTCFSDGWSVHH